MPSKGIMSHLPNSFTLYEINYFPDIYKCYTLLGSLFCQFRLKGIFSSNFTYNRYYQSVHFWVMNIKTFLSFQFRIPVFYLINNLFIHLLAIDFSSVSWLVFIICIFLRFSSICILISVFFIYFGFCHCLNKN